MLNAYWRTVVGANRRQRSAPADRSNDTSLPPCMGAMKDSDQGVGPRGGWIGCSLTDLCMRGRTAAIFYALLWDYTVEFHSSTDMDHAPSSQISLHAQERCARLVAAWMVASWSPPLDVVVKPNGIQGDVAVYA
jgi:hypothetical protein